jgi:methylaspartate ammonia-lyase
MTTEPVQPASRPSSGMAEALAPWLRLMVAVLIALVTMLAVQVHHLRGQVNQLPLDTSATVDTGTDPADVRDVCRLLGALATKQGVPVGTVLEEQDGISQCAEAASDAAH